MTTKENMKFIPMLKRAIKKHDLRDKAICLATIKMGYSNKQLQELEIRNKKYNRLRKKYKNNLNSISYEKRITTKEKVNPNVWICWFQGIETAPEIVKKCVESIYRYLPDKEIHLITSENIDQYIEFPPYILKKWKDGKITYAHISDILRTELLIRYGGMWLDATTYLTAPIPAYVYRKPLFLLHTKVKEDTAVVKNSWFIYAEKDNRTLKVVRDLLYEYWQQENYLSEYFLWHIFLKMAFEKYQEDLNEIDYVSEEMAHCLNYNLFKRYDPIYWEQITRWSTIHKLSYHILYTPDGKMPKDVSGTYYDYIVNNKIE